MRFFSYLISLVIILTACDEPCHRCKSDHVVRINLGGEPQSLDPRKAKDLGCHTLMRMVFEGLARINLEEKTELALAKSVEVSDDLKTYTFHLKHTQWSNGDPVTASDFEYAWKKVLSPSFPSDNAFQLYVIKNGKEAKQGMCSLDAVGVRAVNPLTLQVELENPTPYFMDLLAFPIFFPVNMRVDVETPAWCTKCETFVSNGPFSLKKWEHQDFIEVKKNQKYWDAEHVQLSHILLTMVKGETEFMMFEKNELDWAGSPLTILPLDALPRLREQNTLKVKPALATYFLRVNTEKFPLNSINLRKALAVAIDRESLLGNITYGSQIPATSLVPPGISLQKEPYFNDGDLVQARELFDAALEELQITKENFPKVTLFYKNSERSHLIAQAIVDQWHKVFGVRIGLEANEGKVYFTRVAKQDYDLASCDWYADFSDPVNFLEIFKTKKTGSNNTGWESEEFSYLINQSHSASGEVRRELLQESEKCLLDAMPIIPLFYYTMLYTQNERIQDVAVSSMGTIDFKWASFKDIK